MKRNRKLVYLAGFALSLPIALTSYISSSYLSSFVGEGKIGLLYTAGSVFSILALLVIPKFFRMLGSYRFLLLSTALSAVCLFGLYFSKTPSLLALMFILNFALTSLIYFTLDELLEIFSDNSSIGGMRGLYLVAISSAWVLAQAFSSKFLAGSALSSMYLIASVMMMVFFVLCLFGFRRIEDPEYDKISPVKSVKKFFNNKNLARSYKMNFLLQFFYSWMVIYTPIYLSSHLGFSWADIAKIFTVMLLPFVLIQFPLGKYSDRFGERNILIIGFLTASAAAFSLYFVAHHTVLVWALLLFATRIGAACIEVMADVYFFKHISAESDEFVGIYRNTGPMAYIVGPLLASGLFLVLPEFKYIFLVLAAVMLSGVYIASTIKKTDI